MYSLSANETSGRQAGWFGRMTLVFFQGQSDHYQGSGWGSRATFPAERGYSTVRARKQISDWRVLHGTGVSARLPAGAGGQFVCWSLAATVAVVAGPLRCPAAGLLSTAGGRP